MFKVRKFLMLGCLASVLFPARAYAQETKLVGLMEDLFLSSVVLSKTQAGGGVIAHQPVFANDPLVTPVTGLIQDISQQIGSQLANVPLGSSSGGFTYKYDNSLGTFTRTTQSFGPAFAERAVTTGRGKFSFGMNYQHSRYSALDGKNLEDGAVAIYLPHQIIGNFVEGDMVEADLKIKLSNDAAVFFGNYGVTDRLDLGLVVPIERVKMDLTYHAIIRDFSTHLTSPATHVFSNGQKTQDFGTQGTASGVGDVVVRAKYNFTAQQSRGLALGVDLRLPTGDEENMLGTGATQTAVYLIGSGTNGKLGHHVNAGFTASTGGTDVSNQLNYVGGAEYAVTPRLTVVGDLVGRTFLDSKRLKDLSVSHQFQQSNGGAIETTTLNTVQLASGNLSSVLGTGGVKFSPASNFLVSAHLVFSLNDAGLHRNVTGVLGFDFSF